MEMMERAVVSGYLSLSAIRHTLRKKWLANRSLLVAARGYLSSILIYNTYLFARGQTDSQRPFFTWENDICHVPPRK